MKNLVRALRNLVVVTALMLGLFSPVALAAPSGTLNDACNSGTGNGQAQQSALCQQSNKQGTDNPVAHTLHVATNILALISAVIAVIMMFISGLTLVTSRGDSNSVAGARNRIIYAVVGLLIIAAAWSITSLLVDHL